MSDGLKKTLKLLLIISLFIITPLGIVVYSIMKSLGKEDWFRINGFGSNNSGGEKGVSRVNYTYRCCGSCANWLGNREFKRIFGGKYFELHDTYGQCSLNVGSNDRGYSGNCNKFVKHPAL